MNPNFGDTLNFPPTPFHLFGGICQRLRDGSAHQLVQTFMILRRWILPTFVNVVVSDGLPWTYYLRIENAEGYVLIAVYLFIYLCICVRVIRITQKVLNRIAWNLVGWLVIIRGPFDFGIIRVKGQGHEKVKILFLP